MNLSVYLPQKLVSKISHAAKVQHVSKNSIMKEALEEWIANHYPDSTWSPHFFDFQAIEDAPDFSSYRNELSPPQEDIF